MFGQAAPLAKAGLSNFFVSTWSGAPFWVNMTIVLAVFLASVAAIVKVTMSVLHPVKRAIEIAPDLVAVADLAPKLEMIAAQFRNNGGSTLRDTVDRIEQNQTAIASAVSLQRVDHEKLSAYTHQSVYKLASAIHDQIGKTMDVEERQRVSEARAKQVGADIAGLLTDHPSYPEKG